jgi:hypothetical protein
MIEVKINKIKWKNYVLDALIETLERKKNNFIEKKKYNKKWLLAN